MKTKVVSFGSPLKSLEDSYLQCDYTTRASNPLLPPLLVACLVSYVYICACARAAAARAFNF